MIPVRNGLRYLGLLLLVCALGVSLLSAGAFDSMTQQREVSVAVSENSAFLSFDPAEPTVTQSRVTYAGSHSELVGSFRAGGGNTSTVTLGILTNELTAPLSGFEITVTGTPDGAIDLSKPRITTPVLEPDRSAQLVATVSCGAPQKTTGTATVEIEASGPANDVTITKQVDLTCDTGGEPSDATIQRLSGHR